MWQALVFSTLVSALWPWPARAAPAAGLALHECRLEHPLRLASIAARCGVLSVPLDRTQPAGARIEIVNGLVEGQEVVARAAAFVKGGDRIIPVRSDARITGGS